MAPNLPATMRAQVLESHGTPYVLRSLPTPSSSSPQDLVIRVKAASYCHTDAVLAQGDIPGHPPSFPHIGCHEFTGTVISVGTAASDFNVGDRVAVAGRGFHPCGTCEECAAGPEIEAGDVAGDPVGYSCFCLKSGLCGISAPGGFAEYAVVDARQVNRIPDGLNDVQVAPLMCAGMTMYTALRKAMVGKGSVVGLVGAGGGLGHLGMQFAEKMGAKVVGVESADAPLKLARGTAAAETNIVDARTTKATDVYAHDESRPDVDVSFVLPESQAAFDYAMGILRNRGTCVLVSFPAQGFHISPFDICFRHLNVTGILGGTASSTEEMLRLVAETGIQTHVKAFPFEKLNELVEKYKEGEGGKYVIDMTLPSDQGD